MEEWTILCIVGAIFLLPYVISIIALVRSVRTRRMFRNRIERLEIQGDWFRRRLGEIAGPAPGAAAEARAAEPPLELEPEAEEELLELEEEPEELELPAPPAPEESAPPPTTPSGPRREPAPAPPPRRTAPPPAGPRRPSFDWERWIGVQGAALLGGIVLAAAALLFFKYSFEQGWISPTIRVVVGVLAGLGGLIGAEWSRRSGYRITSEAIAGASIVILYAAFWAAGVRYDLVPLAAAFVLMILVTAAACALAIRYDSLVVAVLGLIGGFATPLLLSTGADRPFGLFGYILLLDLGLLAVARSRRWPSLGALSLLATVGMQALWIFLRMDRAETWIGLLVLGVFALLFAGAVAITPAETRKRWMGTQTAAVLLPFAFALYFAGRVDLGDHLGPVGALLLLLCAAAGWIARVQRTPWLSIGAAVGAVSVVGIYVVQHPPQPALSWETAGVCVALAALFHGLLELAHRKRESLEAADPAAIATLGLFAALGIHVVAGLYAQHGDETAIASPWPYLAGWLALTGLAHRQLAVSRRSWLPALTGWLFGLGATLFPYLGGGPELMAGCLVGVGIVLTALPLAQREGAAAEGGWHGAGLYLVMGTLTLLFLKFYGSAGTAALLGVALMLGLLAAFTAALGGLGVWHLAGVLATALAHFAWSGPFSAGFRDRDAIPALALMALGVGFATAWPFVATKLRPDRWAWYGAALAAPAWFPAMYRVFESRWGEETIGILPIALGLVSFAAVFGARATLPGDSAARRRALVWFSAVALGFVSIAIPLQLDKEWVTVGWALEGLAVTVLWRRLDHAGLKWFGTALLAAVSVRLIANPAVLQYHDHTGLAIVNWLAYTYLIPAACLIGTALLLRPLELERARPAEGWFYAQGWPVCGALSGLGGILVVFAWINLAIMDWFSTGPELQVSFERMPARDATTSIAWALFGLVLLGIGMARSSRSLRWLSLGFLFLTIGKVFLHDLGELQDLYRVVSLLGLALSLILVSFLYQRFVFGKDEESEEASS